MDLNLQDKNLLLAIIEGSNDFIFVKDLKGRYLFINSATAIFFKKTLDQIIGKTDYDLFPAEIATRLRADDEKVINTGQSLNYEEVVHHPDGTSMNLLTTKSLYRDPTGRITGVIGISRDITDRKLAEEALRAEHAYRKPIEDAMLAGVVAMANVTGRLIYTNPAFCNIVGWSEQELLGQAPPFPFWPPEDSENIMKILISRLSNEEPPEIEIRFQRKNGERFPVLIKTAPLTDGQGNKIGIVSTIADITRQKLSETRLRESHNLLNSIIEGTNDAIYLRDLEGRYLMMNTSGAKLFGKSSEEIIGRHMSEFFSPEFVRKFEELDQRILKSGKIETAENKITIKGVDHIFLTTRGPIRNNENEISGFFGISRDITEKKRAEDILQTSEERLAAVIDNSTAVIYMKDLEGKFLLINRKYEDLFHISRKDLIGKTPYDLFPVGIADKFRANDQQVIKKKGPIEFDETVPHDDGPHDYLTVRFPLLDNKGEVYAYVESLPILRIVRAGTRTT
jgi:PAS domain S-box-containing protein